eukprot:101256-Hanusia_phi.AAC.1
MEYRIRKHVLLVATLQLRRLVRVKGQLWNSVGGGRGVSRRLLQGSEQLHTVHSMQQLQARSRRVQ